jgi:hypothetical protein
MAFDKLGNRARPAFESWATRDPANVTNTSSSTHPRRCSSPNRHSDEWQAATAGTEDGDRREIRGRGPGPTVDAVEAIKRTEIRAVGATWQVRTVSKGMGAATSEH